MNEANGNAGGDLGSVDDCEPTRVEILLHRSARQQREAEARFHEPLLRGGAVDLHDVYPLEVPDAFTYIYVLGPDQERIKVWSGAAERVNHVHFTTPDLPTVVSWYQSFLGIQVANGGLFAAFYLDDILFFYEPIGTAADYAPTDDHVLGHIALSVSQLAPWVERAKAQGIEIVAEPAATAGFMSFFVRGPDGLLVELVEAAPSAELCP